MQILGYRRHDKTTLVPFSVQRTSKAFNEMRNQLYCSLLSIFSNKSYNCHYFYPQCSLCLTGLAGGVMPLPVALASYVILYGVLTFGLVNLISLSAARLFIIYEVKHGGLHYGVI